jgi:hypothetical protein
MALVADRRLTRLHLCDILASYAQPEGPPLPRLSYRLGSAEKNRASQLLPPGRPRVALQLGANNDLRRWPLESFASLAKSLAGQGASLVVLGTVAERGLGQRLRQALGADLPLCDLMERTDLPGLAGVLAGCDLLVSADTGTLHLATALGTPCLALYMGPAQAHETGPYGAGHLVLQARDACGPCQEHNPACGGQAPCRQLITPAAAAQAALALLGGARAAQAAAGLDLPPTVEPLEGVLDSFGQRYRQLIPRPLDSLTGLALALRQAGRILLRPAYQHDPQALASELAQEHLPPAPEQARELEYLRQGAAKLVRAASLADPRQASQVGAGWPGLRSLALLAGPQAPPRLEQACRTALACLESAAEIGRAHV